MALSRVLAGWFRFEIEVQSRHLELMKLPDWNYEWLSQFTEVYVYIIVVIISFTMLMFC